MGRIAPWVFGLIDGLAASNLVRASLIEHKERIAFIILDSTLEQVFKKYITNVRKINNIQDTTKWEKREFLIKLVKGKTDFAKETWDDVDFFYNIRTGLYHEESEKTVSPSSVGRFQELVEYFINELFDVVCYEIIPLTSSLFPTKEDVEITTNGNVSINLIKEKINVLIVAVAESQSKSTVELKEVLRRKGLKEEISSSVISVYLTGKSYKHLFYFEDYWKLTDEGRRKYENIKMSFIVKNNGEENG